MSKLSRRDFIKNSMIAGATIAMTSPFSKVRGANNDIRIAVVGTGGQGSGHCRQWSRMEGVRLVAVCDADLSHAERIKQSNPDIKIYQDVRELLDDKSIDAISSATPNHWHSLVTVWACQAGKDVYIEKPASHEIWEGRKMVEATRKYDRIVQIGTQKRSSEAHPAAFEWIREGHIGKIKWVRGFCYKGRGPGTNGIVHGTNGPVPVPESVDYNLWCGPADMVPLNRTELHYVWHWVWNTGCGDIGNQGPHEMDLARWALGDPGLPTRGFSIGGRFGCGETDDIGETANTQIAFFDYKPAPLLFEVRGLHTAKDARRMDTYPKTSVDIGIVVQCEGGYWAARDAGGWIIDNDGNRVKQFAGGGGGSHYQNFLDAVRSHKRSDLNADIEVGHLSASLCHMANISYRIGKKATPNEIKATIGDNAEMMDSFNRMLEHLAANEVDLEKEPITIGPVLTMDPQQEKFVGEDSDMANMFLKRNYREPFVVPDQV
jgi:predicted dehydrogenase